MPSVGNSTFENVLLPLPFAPARMYSRFTISYYSKKRGPWRASLRAVAFGDLPSRCSAHFPGWSGALLYRLCLTLARGAAVSVYTVSFHNQERKSAGDICRRDCESKEMTRSVMVQ